MPLQMYRGGRTRRYTTFTFVHHASTREPQKRSPVKKGIKEPSAFDLAKVGRSRVRHPPKLLIRTGMKKKIFILLICAGNVSVGYVDEIFTTLSFTHLQPQV